MSELIACCVKLGTKPLNVKRTLQAIENLTYNHDNIYLNILMSKDSSIRRIFNNWEEKNRKSFDVIDSHYRKVPYITMNVLVKSLPLKIVSKILFLYDSKPIYPNTIEIFQKHKAKVFGIYNGENVWNYNSKSKKYFKDSRYVSRRWKQANSEVAGISDWLLVDSSVFIENKDLMTMSFNSNSLNEKNELLNFCKKYQYPSKRFSKRNYIYCDFRKHNI